tara:strand:+ start:692 stop:2284 length:1593 start_codon:yes stop_codon:yes gene_type:complete
MQKANLISYLKDKNFLFFSGLILAYGIFLSIFSPADFPTSMKAGFMPYLSDKPVGEDGFYMLDLAWNVASNKGLSYAGLPTTGTQPLVTFIYSLLAWININFLGANKWLLVRHIILFGTFTHIIFSYLMGCICTLLYKKQNNNILIFSIGSSLTLFSFGLYRISTYGLETGFYLLGLAYFFLFLLINLKKGHKLNVFNIMYIGLISGLLILTRIDFLIILGFTLLFLNIKKIFPVYKSSLIFLIALIISSPWFFYVKSITDKFIPSSGGAQSELINFENISSRSTEFVKSFISHFSILIKDGREVLFFSSLIVVFFFVLINFLNKKVYNETKKILSNSIFISFGFSLLLLSLIYFSTSWATHFYYRYISPISIILIPIISINLISIFKTKKYIFFVCILLFTLQSYASLHLGNVGNTNSVTAGYVYSNFQSNNEYIGAFQSGVVGYFNNNVINLDGKLDHNALKAHLRHKDRKDNYKFSKFIEEKNINIIVDWEKYFKNYLNDLILNNKNWVKCDFKINNQQSICLRKIS